MGENIITLDLYVILFQVIGCIGRVSQVFENGNLAVRFEHVRIPLVISSAAVSPVVVYC